MEPEIAAGLCYRSFIDLLLVNMWFHNFDLCSTEIFCLEIVYFTFGSDELHVAFLNGCFGHKEFYLHFITLLIQNAEGHERSVSDIIIDSKG